MRIVTIRDVAKQAGVSISTVSRVLNHREDVEEHTRARVVEVIEKLHYLRNPNASNLKQRRCRFVAVILKGRRNVFLTDLAERILEYGRGTGFDFLLEFIDEKADEFTAARRLYLERKLSGAIFLGSNLLRREQELARLDFPCVFSTVQGSSQSGRQVSSVGVDNRAGGYEVASRLCQLGHRRIALLGYFGETSDSTGQRLYGALDCFAQYGIPYDPDLFVECAFTLPGAYEAARCLLERKKPFTALIAISDIIAMGAVRALSDAGLRVPQDVSVVGFDGIETARFITPSLATMAQPSDDIARVTVELLTACAAGQPGRHVVLKAEWTQGESVRQIK